MRGRRSAFNVAASIKMRKYGGDAVKTLHIIAFNVAASIKMRKCDTRAWGAPTNKCLQCGRIYKDAEINCSGCRSARNVNLQCGRIYKDAEISSSAFAYSVRSILQCGRIYKDAEIRMRELHHGSNTTSFNVAASIKMRKYISVAKQLSAWTTFNVAASIKMRKSTERATPRGATDSLQCGRIYKDAEIYDGLCTKCGR